MDNDIEAVDPVEQCFEHFGILGMKWGRRRSTKELQAARGKNDWEGDSDKNSGKDSTEGSQDYLKTALKGYAESKIAPSTPRHAKSKKKK